MRYLSYLEIIFFVLLNILVDIFSFLFTSISIAFDSIPYFGNLGYRVEIVNLFQNLNVFISLLLLRAFLLNISPAN